MDMANLIDMSIIDSVLLPFERGTGLHVGSRGRGSHGLLRLDLGVFRRQPPNVRCRQ